jgi:hypothetical protein
MDIIEPKPLSEKKQDIVEESFENLLGTLGEISPEVRDLLRKKYEEDEKRFGEAVRDAQPSTEPSYWAKKSCRKCYGRGIIGKQHFFMPGNPAKSEKNEEGKKSYTNSAGQTDIRCGCTAKTYKKWLADFRLQYNMLRAQEIAEALQEEGDQDEE